MDKSPGEASETRTPTHATSAQDASAKLAGLVYVSDSQPGISRIGGQRKFSYRDPEGNEVTTKTTIDRIHALAIPPAYVDVWICAEPHGHIQATGRDARRRKQYRYHVKWRKIRDGGKFERVISFAESLPKLRRAVRRDLSLQGLPREKVLAVVVALLAQTLVRVGNEEYARDNGSFGLTTLRNRHLGQSAGRLAFRFRGKSGQDHEVAIGDARLSRIVRRCQQLPGQHLFQYTDVEGQAQPVDSGLVNEYLREATGAQFSAKDFRTWGGTLAAMVILAQMPLPERQEEDAAMAERAMAQLGKAAVDRVAALLGNTSAVCRASYIHPEVFAAWRDGSLAPAVAGIGSPRQLERKALALLRRRMRTSRKKR